ncbi:MAG: CTP synthase, partial [Verrucomicrobia bacterium]|nr:CTP synthase [Verrucomicrobiota bacterium]
SVAKLREIGLQPQVLICRCEHPLDDEIRRKLSMYCNIAPRAVVEMRDVPHTIYEAPLLLHIERLDQTICNLLRIEAPEPNMADWRRFVKRVVSPKKTVRVAIVDKYIELQDAYKSVYESLTHAGASHDCGIDLRRIDAELFEEEPDRVEKLLHDVTGIVVPGGFGERGVEGKIAAARFAREHRVPYLGLCLGMQIATIEFARNVCGLKGANSTEFDADTPNPIICMLEEQKEVLHKGGSMRLGVWPTQIVPGTLTEKVYGRLEAKERHRHRYEFNNRYREIMAEHGFVISATSPDGSLVEVIELRDHPWFLACQYHPEFQSKPNAPHPLFRGFIGACLAAHQS